MYERLALSRDKEGVKQLATQDQRITRPEDPLKEPCVEGLICDHILGLVENLYRRVERLEREAGLPDKESEAFESLYQRIQNDENQNLELHPSLITGGSADT